MPKLLGQLLAIGLGLVGPLVALVLGVLTFGGQATVTPDHLPLAVGPTDAASALALSSVVDRVSAQSGDAVSWRKVSSRADAEDLLDHKEIYGAVLFRPTPGGLTATVLVSGAINPTATQAAQQALTQVAIGVTAAARAQAPVASDARQAVPPVQVITIHPTSAAGRTLPLAAGILLWLAALATNALVVLLPSLLGRPAFSLAAWVAGLVVAVLAGVGVVVGLAWSWDSSLSFSGPVLGFLVLVGLAFAMLQAAVLRWLGAKGIALLGVLYLMGPAVSSLPPELLNPTYRAWLWSWTPFRFSSEALRSLLFLSPAAGDVQTAVLVFSGLALVGFLLLLPPRRRGRAVPSSSATR